MICSSQCKETLPKSMHLQASKKNVICNYFQHVFLISSSRNRHRSVIHQARKDSVTIIQTEVSPIEKHISAYKKANENSSDTFCDFITYMGHAEASGVTTVWSCHLSLPEFKIHRVSMHLMRSECTCTSKILFQNYSLKVKVMCRVNSHLKVFAFPVWNIGKNIYFCHIYHSVLHVHVKPMTGSDFHYILHETNLDSCRTYYEYQENLLDLKGLWGLVTKSFHLIRQTCFMKQGLTSHDLKWI